MNGLIEGKKYVLSTPVDTVITDVKYNIPLGTVKAGQQYVFQAVSDAVTVADGCTIRPFEGSNGTSVGVVGGSGDGGSSGGSSAYPGWVGYIEYDDETGEAIAADYSGLEVFGNSFDFNINYKFGGDWTSDIPYLKSGNSMFSGCTNLTSVNGDLPSLTTASAMFSGCTNLTSFNGDLSSLTNGDDMFSSCTNLTSFNGDLSSLTSGGRMFNHCKLDKPSVLRIITCLKERNTCATAGLLTLGINKDLTTDADILAALGKSSWGSLTNIIGHGGGTWLITLQAN